MAAIFHTLAWAGIALGLGSAAWLGLAQLAAPPRMSVMGLVWPLTGLYAGPLAIWLYRRHGKAGRKAFALHIAVAACHCGAGCTLGDLTAEALAAGFPGIMLGLAAWGLKPPAADWALDTLLAYLFGIGFQFWAIRPMGVAAGEAIGHAVKADTLSLLAWQAGMIGVMAAVHMAAPAFGPGRAEFWFAMQFAMLAGFVLCYPVNWWLLRAGIKKPM